MKRLTILTVLGILAFYASAQKVVSLDYPKVGSSVIDYEYHDLDNYPLSSFKLSDFRGKWLIVDFWSRFCGGCIASFPKMNDIHKQFKDDVQLVMVGLTPDSLTKALYKKMKALHSLEFTVAFDAESDKYDIYSLPTILVVDPDGVIVAKTLSVNADQIRELISGQKPSFIRQHSAHERVPIDKTLPFLTTGQLVNGGIDTSFLFRSILMKYEDSFYFQGTKLDKPNIVSSGKVEVARYSLEDLYRLAYFGQSSWTIDNKLIVKDSYKLILNVKDSTEFIADRSTNKGLYVYSLIVPPERSNKEFLMNCIQEDLARYFNYNVAIEKREMPAFHLVIVDPDKIKKLRTKGGPKNYRGNDPATGDFGFYLKNMPMIEVIRPLGKAKPNGKQFMPIVDKTGIDYNVDFQIDTYMRDFNKVNEVLSLEYGLKIIEATEIMNTLVVNDK